MQNLLRLIIRFSFQIIFVILEVIALTMVFQRNPLPHARFFQLSQDINGFFYTQTNRFILFFHLTDENSILVTENARLKNELVRRPVKFSVRDSIAPSQPGYVFDYIPAQVVNNSINKQNNYITLNVGYAQGVRQDMGVVGPDGIVGVVRNVSANFSTVISVLNSKFKGSVKLKRNDYFGTLSWPGDNYREAIVTEVPGHAPVYIGDTITTSGFSTIFPPGEMVGVVMKVDRTPAGSFIELKVSLNQNFKKLTR
ncbi:MAG: rod shape-determining protein MreC, partial [Bacteroidia bacterium]|nr:rod shape-determining protein MreC [Bacteroidia bacterium]